MSGYTWEFELVGLPKTTNGGGRAHWRAKAHEASTWIDMVRFTALKERQVPKTPIVKARLTLTRISSAEPDYDGLVSSFKHVIDGLVRAGILSDDKRQNIGVPEYLWEQGSRGAGRIVVRIEEITGVENGK